jgi:hypothetical protein
MLFGKDVETKREPLKKLAGRWRESGNHSGYLDKGPWCTLGHLENLL